AGPPLQPLCPDGPSRNGLRSRARAHRSRRVTSGSMAEVELSAGTIEYDDTGGDGPVVVMLHGLLMGGSIWRNVVRELQADHRCVVPTLPLGAHRRPMHPDADLSLAGHARIVAELLDRLDLRGVTL